MIQFNKYVRFFLFCIAGINVALAQQQATDESTAAPLPMKRVALLIGNQVYAKPEDTISTARQDVQDIATSLKQAGFTTIRVVPDVRTKEEILMWTQELVNNAGPSNDPAIIFFYFTGHGFQSGEWPFLVPTAATSGDIYNLSLSLNTVIDVLSKHRSGLAIFIIDACRNIKSKPSSDDQTFSDVHSAATPVSPVAVIQFSTEYDSPSATRTQYSGDNSPYAFELKSVLGSDLPLAELLGYVGSSVSDDTATRQTPVLIAVPNISRAFLAPSQDEQDKERQVWTSQLQTGVARCIRQFTHTYPTSSFVVTANAWLDSHNGVGDTQPVNCPAR